MRRQLRDGPAAADVEHAKLSTKITTYTDVVAPGPTPLPAPCPQGWISLGAGYALTSGSLRLEGAAAIGAGGQGG